MGDPTKDVIRVKAIELGHYGVGKDLKRRRIGDIFDLVPRMYRDRKTKKLMCLPASQQFSEKWMEKVSQSEQPTESTEKAEVRPAATATSDKKEEEVPTIAEPAATSGTQAGGAAVGPGAVSEVAEAIAEGGAPEGGGAVEVKEEGDKSPI